VEVCSGLLVDGGASVGFWWRLCGWDTVLIQIAADDCLPVFFSCCRFALVLVLQVFVVLERGFS